MFSDFVHTRQGQSGKEKLPLWSRGYIRVVGRPSAVLGDSANLRWVCVREAAREGCTVRRTRIQGRYGDCGRAEGRTGLSAVQPNEGARDVVSTLSPR